MHLKLRLLISPYRLRSVYKLDRSALPAGAQVPFLNGWGLMSRRAQPRGCLLLLLSAFCLLPCAFRLLPHAAASCLPPTALRIQRVAQTITEKVKRKERECHGQARTNELPGEYPNILNSLAGQTPP